MTEENKDFAFENNILKAEKAALEKELETARLATQTANARIVKLTPLANAAVAFQTENDKLKAAAAADATAVKNGKDAVQQLKSFENANKKLADRVTSLQKEKDDKSASVTHWSEQASNLEKDLETTKKQVSSLKAVQKTQSQRNRRLWQWLIGTAAVLVVSVTVAVAGYYRMTTPPVEMSPEALAAWRQYSSEYEQAFKKALGKKDEQIKGLQDELEQTRAKLPSFFGDDGKNWAIWDWGFLLLVAGATAVGGFFVGIFAVFTIFR